MKSIKNIYLVWRKGRGFRRRPVGVIKKNVSLGIRFSYFENYVEEARKEGFSPFTDFPDINKVYTENVIEIFGQRLLKPERTDIYKYYDFWEIDTKYSADKYYLLAYTQGMLSTDNFEFLTDFYPVIGLSFVSEICGLSSNSLPVNTVKVLDELNYKLEKNNAFDENAVKVFKDHQFLGYIKIIHNRVICKSKTPVKITVKRIDQNGFINRIFIRVSI